MGIDRRSTFPRARLSPGYIASSALIQDTHTHTQRSPAQLCAYRRVKWFRLCFRCSRCTINAQTRTPGKRGDEFLGWARRRGVSKRRARRRFSTVMWKGEWLFLNRSVYNPFDLRDASEDLRWNFTDDAAGNVSFSCCLVWKYCSDVLLVIWSSFGSLRVAVC